MTGLRMAVVIETMWSITPWSSGSVTFEMLKMFRTVSDRRFRQPRGSWALAASDASGGHSRLGKHIGYKSPGRVYSFHNHKVSHILSLNLKVTFELLDAGIVLYACIVFPCSFSCHFGHLPYILHIIILSWVFDIVRDRQAYRETM